MCKVSVILTIVLIGQNALIDWLVFNTNLSIISAISWRGQNVGNIDIFLVTCEYKAVILTTNSILNHTIWQFYM